jgi:hypothetical protein
LKFSTYHSVFQFVQLHNSILELILPFVTLSKKIDPEINQAVKQLVS